MPYRICKTIELECGHMLSKHPGRCRYPHGHSRQVEFVLEAERLDGNDMVCDFKVVKEALNEFLDSLDHSMCINTKDPMYKSFKKAFADRVVGLKDVDPTTEVLAKLLFDRVEKLLAEYARHHRGPFPLRKQVRLARVRVWETSTAWAEYEG